MAYWNLHTNFQLPSAMGLRDFDFQSKAVLMGGSPPSHSSLVTSSRATLCQKVDVRYKLLNKLLNKSAIWSPDHIEWRLIRRNIKELREIEAQREHQPEQTVAGVVWCGVV